MQSKSVCLALGVVLSAAASGEGEDLRAYMLASSCFNCHGDGSPNGAGIPSLAGRDATFIRDALTGFRDGSRESTVMQRLARGYSDAEIAHIADWLAAPR
jgi:sulfide dehydrogenase cytochrome subunit